jgi:hypothetical protein
VEFLAQDENSADECRELRDGLRAGIITQADVYEAQPGLLDEWNASDDCGPWPPRPDPAGPIVSDRVRGAVEQILVDGAVDLLK